MLNNYPAILWSFTGAALTNLYRFCFSAYKIVVHRNNGLVPTRPVVSTDRRLHIARQNLNNPADRTSVLFRPGAQGVWDEHRARAKARNCMLPNVRQMHNVTKTRASVVRDGGGGSSSRHPAPKKDARPDGGVSAISTPRAGHSAAEQLMSATMSGIRHCTADDCRHDLDND